jgi:hypothetical protein
VKKRNSRMETNHGFNDEFPLESEERRRDFEKVNESLSYANPFRKRLDDRHQEILMQVFRTRGQHSYEQKTLRKLLDDVLDESKEEFRHQSTTVSPSDQAVSVPRMKDLRILDFTLNTTDDHMFIVRKDAILLSLGQIRGIVTSTRLIIILPPGGMDQILETIGEYISGELASL